MGADHWFPVAMFLVGCVATGIGMLIREDAFGKRHAEAVRIESRQARERLDMELKMAEERLSEEIDHAEKRLNERIDREMTVIGRELREIKETLVRIEARNQ